MSHLSDTKKRLELKKERLATTVLEKERAELIADIANSEARIRKLEWYADILQRMKNTKKDTPEYDKLKEELAEHSHKRLL